MAEACARVLAPHGSLCVELGDTYSGSGGGGGDYLEGGQREGQAQFAGSDASMRESNAAHWRQKNPPKKRPDYNPGGEREGQDKFDGTDYTARQDTKYPKVERSDHAGGITNLHGKIQGGGRGWPLAKSLSLIPESFRFAMVYGFNPHTGRQTEPWRLRNVIRWVRPNPPVGALGDKFRPATSELMVFCKSAKRYFDLDAVREQLKDSPGNRYPKERRDWDLNSGKGAGFGTPIPPEDYSSGAPPLDWWKIPAGETPKLRRPCEHGRYDRHHLSEGLKVGDLTHCPGGEFLAADLAPPLDWWNIPLLEGEEETRYGPKQKPPHGTTGFLSGNKFGIRQKVENTETQPLGAPPLDWWNIPLLEGEEETRYGPKEPPKETKQRNRQAEPSMTRGGSGVETDGWHRFPNVESSNPLGAPPLDWWELPVQATETPLIVVDRGDAVEVVGEITADSRWSHIESPLLLDFALTVLDRLATAYKPDTGGAPPLDWWEIPPGGYEGAHYAVFPPELCVKPVKAMCPEKVCRTCGEPSRRIVGEAGYERNGQTVHGLDEWPWGGNEKGRRGERKSNDGGITRVAETTGFSDCGHDDWRPGMVLDCFGGSGTTALVATGHGRDCILIDLDERNYELALERVGPFILTRGEDD